MIMSYFSISFKIPYLGDNYILCEVQQHRRTYTTTTNKKHLSLLFCAFLPVSPGAVSSSCPDISHYIVYTVVQPQHYAQQFSIYLAHKYIYTRVCICVESVLAMSQERRRKTGAKNKKCSVCHSPPRDKHTHTQKPVCERNGIISRSLPWLSFSYVFFFVSNSEAKEVTYVCLFFRPLGSVLL